MNRVKLTKKVIESAKPGKAEFVLWDRQLIGFGCKITPKGNLTRIMISYCRPIGVAH